MTDPAPAHDDPARRRNRLTLLAIVALFFGSMLVAGVLRFSGWQPAGTKAHGELLSPPLDLRAHEPVLLDGATYAWNPPARTWRVAIAPPTDCGEACAKLAHDLDVVWRLMGRNADHLDILWLCPDEACVVPSPLREDRTLRRLRSNPAWSQSLPRSDAAAAGAPVYVIDPNGFVILRYPPGADPGGLRADLAKLMKLI